MVCGLLLYYQEQTADYICLLHFGSLVYFMYSGILPNPSTADTHSITDNSESLDHYSIDFNTLKTPE